MVRAELVVNAGGGELSIISGDPVDLSCSHLFDVHVAAERHLGDLDAGEVNWLQLIGLPPESSGDGRDGDLVSLGVAVIEVGHVLKAKMDVVLALWNWEHLHGIDDACVLHGLAEDLWDADVSSLGEIEVEEVLCGVIGLLLALSLQWLSLDAVANLDVVSSWHFHSVSELVPLLKWLTYTLAVVAWGLSVLHKLDGALRDSSAALSSVVHDGEQSGGGGVLHGDGRVDWVVVGGDVLGSLQVPCWSVVQDSLLHLKAI